MTDGGGFAYNQSWRETYILYTVNFAIFSSKWFPRAYQYIPT